MQMPLWSKKGKVITVTCTFVVALAVTLISGAPARAQATHQPGTPGVVKPNVQPLTTHSGSDAKPLRPWGTFFDTNSSTINASCATGLCIDFTTIFAEQVVCPVERGDSCTFQITIESQNEVGSGSGLNGEDGLYQFNVDGAAPNPGPVDTANGCNCYSWSIYQPNSGARIGTSYAVTATVKNTTNRQKHSVEVSIGCAEFLGDPLGCYANTHFANLQVAVYTRNWLLF
jgi:hypothetical protein